MPRKDGTFTRTEQDFMEAYAQTQDREKAEKLAGLAPRSGYAILGRAEVQAELSRRMMADVIELGPLAVNIWKRCLTEQGVPWAVKEKAAGRVVDLIKEIAPETTAKDISEWTAEELAAGISALSALMIRQSDLAIDVTPAEGVFD